jgi:predicted DsbA family dithiol-disulfide isomerase
MKTQKKLQIDVYTDVICPWCWLGKRRLEKAIESIPGLETDVRYLPYELNPATPREGIDRVKHLTAKYGGGIATMDARIAGFGKEVGLEYHFEEIGRIPNTFNAHRVIWLAGKEGVQKSVTEALHEAYFRDGKDIGDKKILTDVASGAGLEKAKVEKLLNSEQGVEEVRALEENSYNMGISGVPYFVFKGETALSGAHPVETFVSILKQLTM